MLNSALRRKSKNQLLFRPKRKKRNFPSSNKSKSSANRLKSETTPTQTLPKPFSKRLKFTLQTLSKTTVKKSSER